MATLTDTASYTPNNVYELNGVTPDAVQGGANGAQFGGLGNDNEPHQILANRTAYLYNLENTLYASIFPYILQQKNVNYSVVPADGGTVIYANSPSTTITLPNPSTMTGQWVGVLVSYSTISDLTTTVATAASTFWASSYTWLVPTSLALYHGDIVYFYSNGSVWIIAAGNAAVVNNAVYTLGAVTSDLALKPGNKVTINFSNATTVPLRVATAQGLYRVTVVLTANSTLGGENPALYPNNTTYGTSIYNVSLEVGEVDLAGVAAAGGVESMTTVTNAPYISNLATSWNSNAGFFASDIFAGPSASDTLWDRGNPMIVEMLISTYTTNKMIKWDCSDTGGRSITSSLWQDTTTAWTSLGTFQQFATTQVPLSGSIIIERVL